MATKLSARREAWCTHYLMCWNQTQAALLAGYAPKSAHVEGSRLIRDANIQARLRELMSDVVMTPEEVLARFTEIARSDISDIVDENGNLDIAKAREQQKTHLIKTIKSKSVLTTDEDGEGSDVFETRVEIFDKLRALESLAKYHNLTTRIQVEDWHSQAITDIRAGKLDWQQLADLFDTTLADELFAQAGVNAERD